MAHSNRIFPLQVLSLILMSLSFGAASYADTEIDCQGFGEGEAEGLTVQYSHWSFQPCDGPCPKRVEALPVLEVKRQLEADVAEVFTSNQAQLTIVKRLPEITRTKRVTQKLNSKGKALGEPSTRFVREEKFEALIELRHLSNESIRVYCTKKIDSAKFL